MVTRLRAEVVMKLCLMRSCSLNLVAKKMIKYFFSTAKFGRKKNVFEILRKIWLAQERLRLAIAITYLKIDASQGLSLFPLKKK